MSATSLTLSVFIRRGPREVTEFLLDPANLPKWAGGLCKSVSKTLTGWIAHTPRGDLPIRFVEPNSFGIADHYVMVAPGVEVYVPLRVLPLGEGCEVIFTVLRQPAMTDQDFAGDAAAVQKDLDTLRTILE